MRTVIHRFLVPPVLLGLHLLLLLPLLFTHTHVDDSDEDERRPEGPLWRDLRGSNDEEEDPLLTRLHLKYSVPIGVLGLVLVQCLKQLVGKVQLPLDPRWRGLTERIETSVLFGLGVSEELVRWGMVRLLVKLEGGSGGFRGRGELWDLTSVYNTKYPSIWEGIYLMGWVWSLSESCISWWTFRPEAVSPLLPLPPDGGDDDLECAPSSHTNTNINSERRPLLGKRQRSDYSGINASDTESTHHQNVNPLFGSFYRKKRDLGTPPYSQDAHHNIPPPQQSQQTPSITTTDTDTTPRARAYAPSLSSSHAYGYGDNELSSSAISLRSSIDAQTPILSSSLPYDPEQVHMPTTLVSGHRQTSYSTLSEIGAAPTATLTDDDESICEVHEDDALAPISPVGLRRTYPSWPSYSPSYVAAHFPGPPPPASGSASSAGDTVPPTTNGYVYTDYDDREEELEERTVYGIPVTTLPAWLPISWRTCAALRHIGHSLLFAWAPWILFEGELQYWTVLVVGVLCGARGWHVVEWVGGGATKRGIRGSSIIALLIAACVGVVAAGVWDLVW